MHGRYSSRVLYHITDKEVTDDIQLQSEHLRSQIDSCMVTREGETKT